jgi:hypothetical protein
MYPCCPVLPVLNFLTGKLKSKDGGQAKARTEVKKALQDYLEAQAAERKP